MEAELKKQQGWTAPAVWACSSQSNWFLVWSPLAVRNGFVTEELSSNGEVTVSLLGRQALP